jgi:hypothetical protein
MAGIDACGSLPQRGDDDRPQDYDRAEPEDLPAGTGGLRADRCGRLRHRLPPCRWHASRLPGKNIPKLEVSIEGILLHSCFSATR